MTLSVLTICTGNICRSPVAERIFAAELALAVDVEVRSAGTSALVGASPPDPAIRISRESGVDLSGHTARQMTNQMLLSADLVIAMTREHRRMVVETAPSAMRKTFTLRELARLAIALQPQLSRAIVTPVKNPEDAIRAAIVLASSMRGTLPPPDLPEDLDVIDPYRQSDDVYYGSFAQLVPAARAVSRYLVAATDVQ